jgi:hypothetical protein
MSIEKNITHAATDTVHIGKQAVEQVVHRAWSLLDAASEKKSPGEYLNRKAIDAIQGKLES